MNFRVSLIPAGNRNRPGTKLATNVQPYITVHETSNYNNGADAAMHERFTHQGGGDAVVSFHFVVDDHEAIQLLPCDEIGWHAGDGCDEYPDNVGHDDIGCFASVSIETCVNGDGNWEQTKHNLSQLIAMIASGDNRINWGDGRYKSRMSKERIAQHNAWSGKNCPLRIRAEGSWQELMNWVDDEWAKLVGVTPPQPEYRAVGSTPAWNGLDHKDQNGVWWYAINRKVRLKSDTTPYAYAEATAENKAGPRLRSGSSFVSRWAVKTHDRKWWYVSDNGYRILMNQCFEQFKPTYRREA